MWAAVSGVYLRVLLGLIRRPWLVNRFRKIKVILFFLVSHLYRVRLKLFMEIKFNLTEEYCFTLGNLYHRKDLLIILDSSRSINSDTYESSMVFLHNLMDYMSISPGTTRIALITFSSKAKLEFNFEKYVNRECIKRKLESLLERLVLL